MTTVKEEQKQKHKQELFRFNYIKVFSRASPEDEAEAAAVDTPFGIQTQYLYFKFHFGKSQRS